MVVPFIWANYHDIHSPEEVQQGPEKVLEAEVPVEAAEPELAAETPFPEEPVAD